MQYTCMFIPDFHDGLLAFILESLNQSHVAGFSTVYGLICRIYETYYRFSIL